MTQPKVEIDPRLLQKLPRCPYRQDLKLVCFQDDCEKSDCPIWIRAEELVYQKLPGCFERSRIMSQYYGTRVLHPRSVAQVIADIEAMMRDEVEGTPGYKQCERALNYWRNRPPKRKKGAKL